jgi:hypothetical protein
MGQGGTWRQWLPVLANGGSGHSCSGAETGLAGEHTTLEVAVGSQDGEGVLRTAGSRLWLRIGSSPWRWPWRLGGELGTGSRGCTRKGKVMAPFIGASGWWREAQPRLEGTNARGEGGVDSIYSC